MKSLLIILLMTISVAGFSVSAAAQDSANTLPATTPAASAPADGGATGTNAAPAPAPAASETPPAESAAPVQASPAPVQGDSAYRINGGDVIHVSVYGERDLDRDVAVEPDGGIAFPLVGNLNARGLSLSELQHKIADSLRSGNMLPNVTDAEVTVSLVKSSGNSFSVIGQVKQPGTFVTGTEVDVMQALSLAGGLTPFASKSRIIVLRRGGDGVQKKIPFDYSAVEDGDKLDTNILLQGGDVVVVPQAGLGF